MQTRTRDAHTRNNSHRWWRPGPWLGEDEVNAAEHALAGIACGRAAHTLNAPGSQLGKSELRMARVATCVLRLLACMLFSLRVRSMMAA